MKLRLVYSEIGTLPKMAWCAKIKRLEPTIEVTHGSWVEVFERWFCEGAWSGDFRASMFESVLIMGSAGKIIDDSLLIAGPNHSLERIYTLRKANTMWVSNSYAFILAQANEAVDPGYLLYQARYASIIYGLERYARSLPTLDGLSIRMYCHCNVRIGPDLRITEEPKPSVRKFTDFEDYRSFLEKNVAAIHANANDKNRKIRYRPIATISAGYDSPAAAVFAKSIGCNEALTFEDARPGDSADTADSGAHIATILGMKVTTLDRLDLLEYKWISRGRM